MTSEFFFLIYCFIKGSLGTNGLIHCLPQGATLAIVRPPILAVSHFYVLGFNLDTWLLWTIFLGPADVSTIVKLNYICIVNKVRSTLDYLAFLSYFRLK